LSQRAASAIRPLLPMAMVTASGHDRRHHERAQARIVDDVAEPMAAVGGRGHVRVDGASSVAATTSQ